MSDLGGVILSHKFTDKSVLKEKHLSFTYRSKKRNIHLIAGYDYSEHYVNGFAGLKHIG